MERFTGAFEALLAALADAVKQLGEGSQQPWARTRVEEAKQDFVNCCDVMCFQLKQAVEMIRQEMLQHATSPGLPQGPAMDSEHVRQVLAVAEQFAAQLRSGGAATAAAAAAAVAAAGGGAGDGSGTTTAAAAAGLSSMAVVHPLPAGAGAGAGMQLTLGAADPPAVVAAQGAAAAMAQSGGLAHPQLPQQQQHPQVLAGGGGYGAYM